MTSFERYTSLVGRVMLAVLFVMSGVSKIAAPGPTLGYIGAAGLPMPYLAYGVALLVEVGGGLMLLLGYRTRPAAIVLALFALATAALFHSNFADQNQLIHFLKNVAIAGGLLHTAAFGAGAISLDARGRRFDNSPVRA